MSESARPRIAPPATAEEYHHILHSRNMMAWRVLGACEQIMKEIEANYKDPAKVLGSVARMKVYFTELDAMPKVPTQRLGQ